MLGFLNNYTPRFYNVGYFRMLWNRDSIIMMVFMIEFQEQVLFWYLHVLLTQLLKAELSIPDGITETFLNEVELSSRTFSFFFSIMFLVFSFSPSVPFYCLVISSVGLCLTHIQLFINFNLNSEYLLNAPFLERVAFAQRNIFTPLKIVRCFYYSGFYSLITQSRLIAREKEGINFPFRMYFFVAIVGCALGNFLHLINYIYTSLNFSFFLVIIFEANLLRICLRAFSRGVSEGFFEWPTRQQAFSVFGSALLVVLLSPYLNPVFSLMEMLIEGYGILGIFLFSIFLGFLVAYKERSYFLALPIALSFFCDVFQGTFQRIYFSFSEIVAKFVYPLDNSLEFSGNFHIARLSNIMPFATYLLLCEPVTALLDRFDRNLRFPICFLGLALTSGMFYLLFVSGYFSTGFGFTFFILWHFLFMGFFLGCYAEGINQIHRIVRSRNSAIIGAMMYEAHSIFGRGMVSSLLVNFSAGEETLSPLLFEAPFQVSLSFSFFCNMFGFFTSLAYSYFMLGFDFEEDSDSEDLQSSS